MLNSKVNGEWISASTQQVKDTVDQLSAGLLSMGIGGHDMTVENQDKIALISKNRPEWIILDLACQQIGALLCPIYPTTNINDLELIRSSKGKLFTEWSTLVTIFLWLSITPFGKPVVPDV